MENQELIPVESKMIAENALEWCRSIQSVEIKSNEQSERATTLFREVNGYLKTLDEERAKVKQPHLDAGREIDAYFKSKQTPLINLKSQLDYAIRAYQKELEDKRRAEQERLNRIAEEARRKQEEAARVQREKEEAARRAEEDARRRAEEAASAEERKVALAEAEARRREAEKAAASAQAKENKAETIIAPLAQTVVPKAEGISYRANWKMERTNNEAFVQWAVENHKLYLLTGDESACNLFAKQAKTPATYTWGRIYDAGKLSGRAI